MTIILKPCRKCVKKEEKTKFNYVFTTTLTKFYCINFLTLGEKKVMPVSWEYRSVDILAVLIVEALKKVLRSSRSVSYTHLDVYKRQLLSIPCHFCLIKWSLFFIMRCILNVTLIWYF